MAQRRKSVLNLMFSETSRVGSQGSSPAGAMATYESASVQFQIQGSSQWLRRHLFLEVPSKRSARPTQTKAIQSSPVRLYVPVGNRTLRPRNTARSIIAASTTAKMSSKTALTFLLFCVLSTRGALAKTKRKHGRKV